MNTQESFRFPYPRESYQHSSVIPFFVPREFYEYKQPIPVIVTQGSPVRAVRAVRAPPPLLSFVLLVYHVLLLLDWLTTSSTAAPTFQSVHRFSY